MNKIKYAIVILVVIILIIIGILLSINSKDKGITQYEQENQDSVYTEIEKETTLANFKLVDNIANKFFNYISRNEEYFTSIEIVGVDFDFNKAIYGFLDQSYVQENKIEEENLENLSKQYKRFKSYSTREIYINKIERDEDILNAVFYVKGVVRSDGIYENVYLIIRYDLKNYTYSIEPIIKDEYNKFISGNTIIENEFTIDRNEYNYAKTETVSDYDMCLMHMEDYKKALSNNDKEAYELLDKEYREKRFGSLENFKKYRQEKQETYNKESFSQYLVNNYDKHKEYVCKDQYGNIYVFTEELPMQYTMKLDSYTIDTEKFIKEYENGNEQTKVQLCINKFILMLNNQDYEAAYKILDESFKNTYFPTQEEFNAYIKNNSYRYNNLKFTSFDVVGNTYSCKVSLTDLTEGKYIDDTKGTGGSGYIFEWNFLIHLKEDREFILAFQVV